MGDAGRPVTTVSQDDARAALTSRAIPTMTLSSATSPLTAALPPSTIQHPAFARFSTPGNAVLTGGAGTLALASARALLEHGLTGLTLLDLPSTLESSARSIEAIQADFPNTKIFTFPCDVTSESSVQTAMSNAACQMGSIDMLCCFAGIVGCVHAIDTSAAAFRKVIDVNLTGSFICAQAAARHMITQNEKRLANAPANPPTAMPGYSILFTASISAHATNYPQPQSSYNASKIGLLSLTKSLAAEWCHHGIRVNSISPGYLDTILNAGDPLQDVRAVWASRNPMGRMGDVDEVTPAVVMLSSPRGGRYLNGTDITVDGGAMCF